LGLVGAEKKASQAQRAWRILTVAIDRFLYQGMPFNDLVHAYDLGEDILHETQTQSTKWKPPKVQQRAPEL
jgi:hypothetical protein